MAIRSLGLRHGCRLHAFPAVSCTVLDGRQDPQQCERGAAPNRWITRPPGTPPADQSGLLAAITSLQLDGPPGAAYLAGEARTIQSLRTALITGHGCPHRAIRTKPFWTPGKRGLE